MKVHKGDTVIVIAGKDKGATGEIIAVDPEAGRVTVQGVNLVKKHQRPTGNVRTQTGIVEREAPLRISNVAWVCPHCDKPTRVGYRVNPDGTKSRVCKKCGEVAD